MYIKCVDNKNTKSLKIGKIYELKVKKIFSEQLILTNGKKYSTKRFTYLNGDNIKITDKYYNNRYYLNFSKRNIKCVKLRNKHNVKILNENEFYEVEFIDTFNSKFKLVGINKKINIGYFLYYDENEMKIEKRKNFLNKIKNERTKNFN